jgi:hypothetical protein
VRRARCSAAPGDPDIASGEAAMDPQVYVNRVIRMVKLDTTVFEDMRDDPQALLPAIVIAAISFLLAGIGGWLWWIISSYPDTGKMVLESVIVGTITATIAWIVWVGVAFFMLTNVFKYEADFQRMLKSCGLAVIPFALSLLMFIPGINLGVGLLGIGLSFLLMDIGIQVSVEAQPGHVILATFSGFVVFCLALSLLVGISGSSSYEFAPGPFLFRLPASRYADLSSAFKGFAGSGIPSTPKGAGNINFNDANQINAAINAAIRNAANAGR